MTITFCINTTKNEKHHLMLLFKSLYVNLSNRNHNFLVYVENDGEGTVDFLLEQKKHFPNLTIIKNPLPIPIGYGRNINLMFEMATTDVVSYLQSDMVIGPNYDVEILKELTDDNVISSTRIEPPLHPPSDEKITHDFGLDPQSFDLVKFCNFSNNVKSNKITDFWFAPFTIKRKTWLSIGGHDTLFRRSREDSDLLYRFSILGIKTIQTWNANVYHFTCTSSRGKEWWKSENQSRFKLQQSADQIEMMRFLKKWPNFKHSSSFDPDKEYKYHISLNLINTNINHVNQILNNFYKFHRIYVDNEDVRTILESNYDKFHIWANSLLSISHEQWQTYKKYYRTIEFKDIFINIPITSDDIIVNIDMNNTILENTTLHLLNDIVHINNDLTGTFECDGLQLTINNAINHIKDNVIVLNPPIDDIKFEIL